MRLPHLLAFASSTILACGQPAGLDPPPASVTFVGAGDIASCGSSGDEATADLLDAIPGEVFTLGDNVYESGTPEEFANCYEPSWGRHKARTHPSPGNHEYSTPGAGGYYQYFGAAAGDPDRGYYSFDLGDWHIVVLNSNIARDAQSDQVQWLKADLAAHPSRCTLAYWHHPRFSSGMVADDLSVQAFWDVLYQHDADLVLAGHDHFYERFAPQNPSGGLDFQRGIRQFIVGTGGRSHHGATTMKAHSERFDRSAFGVLKLTLSPDGYAWEFIPEAGESFTDSGVGECH